MKLRDRSLRNIAGGEAELVDVGEDSLPDWLSQLYGAFGIAISDDARLLEFVRAVFHGERVIGVRDKTGYVATAAGVSTVLSLPGSAETDTWCLTGLTVDPTWRRQGLFRTAMSVIHERCVEIGMSATVLCPSEWPIYGRFGYGPATSFDTIAVDTPRVRWRDDAPGLDKRVRRVTGEEAGEIARRVYESRRRRLPGDVRPPDAYWSRFAHEPGYNRIDELLGLASRDAAVRHCAALSDGGVVAYRLKPAWTAESTPDYALEVTDLLAIDREAEAALWRHVFSVDLVSEVRASRVSIDHPLRWWLRDTRAVRVKQHDGVWLRPLCVETLLQDRQWSGSGVLTLRVHDAEGYASGTYILDVDDGVASCTRAETSSDPDLELDASALGAIFLAGTSARALASAGVVQTKDATIPQRWDALATPERPPFTCYPL